MKAAEELEIIKRCQELKIEPPPLETVEYFPSGSEKRLGCTSKAFRWLEKYVQKRLKVSGVIPEHHVNTANPFSVAAKILYIAWRQPNPICVADFHIELALKHPPDAIDERHFSLKAFIKTK